MSAIAPLATRPLVIEFVGAPGAGKSTLLPIVYDACQMVGLRPATVVEAARSLAERSLPGRVVAVLLHGRARSRAAWLVFRWASAAASVRHVRRTWPLAWRVLRSQRGRPAGADAGRRRVLYWFQRLLGAHGLFLRRALPGEVLLLDEGYVHRVVQLFTSGVEDPDPVAVRRYLETVPVPDLLVAVHTPVERCVERVTARGVWERLQGRDGDELGRFVRNAHRGAELAVGYARARGWDVIEVENGDDGICACEASLRAALRDRLKIGLEAA